MDTKSEWVTGIKEGYRTKVFQTGNATVYIHRPILTPEEQAKAEQRVIDALRSIGKDLRS